MSWEVGLALSLAAARVEERPTKGRNVISFIAGRSIV